MSWCWVAVQHDESDREAAHLGVEVFTDPRGAALCLLDWFADVRHLGEVRGLWIRHAAEVGAKKLEEWSAEPTREYRHSMPLSEDERVWFKIMPRMIDDGPARR